MDWIKLDGSEGEGGGQILRTALTLSLITGKPFAMERIRARRQKPGLLRQHLTAVQAATALGQARVDGASLGALALRFEPGPVRGGDYRFAIGTAGSCTLVLQTVVPALWYADGPATVTVCGGTHNPAAPPADYLRDCWLPRVRAMGAETTLELKRHGFYPAGGGEVMATTQPAENGLTAPPLHPRGALLGLRLESLLANVPTRVGLRQLAIAREYLAASPLADVAEAAQALMALRDDEAPRQGSPSAALPQGITEHLRELPPREGPGNAFLITVIHEAGEESFVGFGARGVSSEEVVGKAMAEAQNYLLAGDGVGEHLADQLVLPLALAGGGSLRTARVSSHLSTNLRTIEAFLPVTSRFVAEDGLTRVDILPRSRSD